MKIKISPEEFISKYISSSLNKFEWQHAPIQAYSLQEIGSHINVPTPAIYPDYNYLVLLTRGSFTQRIGNEEIMVSAPSVFASVFGSFSSLLSIDKDIEGYFILVKDKVIGSLVQDKALLRLFTMSPLLVLDEGNISWLCTICKALKAELEAKLNHNNIAEYLLGVILLKIVYLSSAKTTIERKEEIAFQFKMLVHQHYKREHQLQYYADVLLISLNYLNRCVVKVFQTSAKMMIQEIQINRAQALLHDRSKSIAEVCYELNFDNPSYFARLFKKVMGDSPSAYRNKLR